MLPAQELRAAATTRHLYALTRSDEGRRGLLDGLQGLITLDPGLRMQLKLMLNEGSPLKSQSLPAPRTGQSRPQRQASQLGKTPSCDDSAVNAAAVAAADDGAAAANGGDDAKTAENE